jgi:hypothetical protein
VTGNGGIENYRAGSTLSLRELGDTVCSRIRMLKRHRALSRRDRPTAEPPHIRSIARISLKIVDT